MTGEMGDFKVLLANPRGFCRGVEMAIDVVNLALELCGTPLYVKHAIVHNKAVIRQFEQKGVIFVEDVEEIPEGSFAVFSAHGSPPGDYQKANAREIDVIDATCHLVNNVHNWARRFAQQGYSVIVIGHRDHPEPRGILGHVPADKCDLIESIEEAERVEVDDPEKVACVTQTTLAIDETQEIRAALQRRFPDLKEPMTPNSTICYATDNRQAAVKELARHSDVVLVVGSRESSNTNRLCEVAAQYGAQSYRIDWAHEIDPVWLEGAQVVGVTSGASAPEELVQGVLNDLKDRGATEVETLSVVDENVAVFSLPDRLAELAQDQGLDIGEARKGRRSVRAS